MFGCVGMCLFECFLGCLFTYYPETRRVSEIVHNIVDTIIKMVRFQSKIKCHSDSMFNSCHCEMYGMYSSCKCYYLIDSKGLRLQEC